MYGGTWPRRVRHRASSGLSPRVRGNPLPGECAPGPARSIPACTGEPRTRSPRAKRFRVYPRVYGGTSTASSAGTRRRGLSPRVRGNRAGPRLPGRRPGSIPACTGEPSSGSGRPCRTGVYPRVYGGTLTFGRQLRMANGLSPRVRGNQGPAAIPGAISGSIPACTGEPRRRPRTATATGVYPRVYGGTCLLVPDHMDREGLSPRVRGNHDAVAGAAREPGSIPACTGEPSASRPGPWRPPVYPRVYGGTTATPTRPARNAGLSPRVRGNHRRAGSCRGVGGSIPACTGEPTTAVSAGRPARVYPRVYGGTLGFGKHRASLGGLSPRVRGNLVRGSVRRPEARSIPACTGEPPPRCPATSWWRVYPRVYGGTVSSRK